MAAAIEATELDGVRLADYLVTQPGSGPITSFMTPVQLAVANGAPVPTTDAEVKALFSTALSQAPVDRSQLLAQLLEGDVSSGSVSSPSGLMVTFFEAPADADEAALLTDLQAELAATLRQTASGDVTALPFSTQLIAATGEESAIEIPLLIFGAIGIIGLALLLVYWPGQGMRRLQRVRRTFADTLVTLLVVVFAITATDGVAVLLGPDGLGLIGSVSGAGSIVPILIVGLGVDYVIHLNAAYRNGLGERNAVEAAMGRSVRIVGGALVLSAITTSFGFLTNLFSGTPSLVTFGILATVGILTAFVFANLLFPASRVLLDRRAARKERLPAEAFATSDSSWIDRIVGATAVIPRRAPWAAVGMAGVDPPGRCRHRDQPALRLQLPRLRARGLAGSRRGRRADRPFRWRPRRDHAGPRQRRHHRPGRVERDRERHHCCCLASRHRYGRRRSPRGVTSAAHRLAV